MEAKQEIKDQDLLRWKDSMDIFDLNRASLDTHVCSLKTRAAPADSLRQQLLARFPKRFTYSREERLRRNREYKAGDAPKTVSTQVDILARFIVAFTGGVFLMVPVCIMAIGAYSLRVCLGITGAFVSMFAIVLSFSQARDGEVLAATATYAAVLTVFIGALLSNGDGASGTVG